MTREDFETMMIRCCTPEDIIATGANLKDVAPHLITMLDSYCRLIGIQVVLLKNGLTSGVHISPEHEQGIAVDIGFKIESRLLCVPHLVAKAFYSGFRGVGVYWNEVALSMHLDIGNSWRQWCKTRGSDKEWRQKALIVNPIA